MTGRQVHIAIYLAMLRYGEDEATGEEVVELADECFPHARSPADVFDCTFWLNQSRKHLVFLREPGVRCPPTVRQLLQWAVSTGGDWVYPEDIENLRRVLLDEGLLDPTPRMRVSPRPPKHVNHGEELRL